LTKLWNYRYINKLYAERRTYRDAGYYWGSFT
jgi:hypothetical protein